MMPWIAFSVTPDCNGVTPEYNQIDFFEEVP